LSASAPASPSTAQNSLKCRSLRILT
jgi:hypothetical protein